MYRCRHSERLTSTQVISLLAALREGTLQPIISQSANERGLVIALSFHLTFHGTHIDLLTTHGDSRMVGDIVRSVFSSVKAPRKQTTKLRLKFRSKIVLCQKFKDFMANSVDHDEPSHPDLVQCLQT